MSLKKMCNHTIPVLPQVYGDELSYYETLGKLIGNYNEVIDIITKIEEYLKNTLSPVSVFSSKIDGYIGVPEITSTSQGVLRIDTPGLYVFNVSLKINSTSIKKNNVDTLRKITSFEYYLVDTAYNQDKSDEFETRKFGKTIYSWDGSPDYSSLTVNNTFVKSYSSDDLNIRKNGYVDILIDPFSYNLNNGDDNIPCEIMIEAIRARGY